MKAAVFYDVEDIRLEDVPEPEIGDDGRLVEVAACGICGSDLEYYYGRSPVGTADGKGPLILGHEFSGVVVAMRQGRARAWPRATGSRSTRSSRAPSDDLSRSGNPHFDLSTVLGVTTNGGFAQLRPHQGRARLQAARLDDRRAGRVRRDAGRLAERGREGGHPARRPRRHLRPRPGRPLDGAARRRLAAARVVDRRHARLPARAREGAWAPTHVFNIADKRSPYYTADLAASIQEVNGGELAERAIVATASEEADAAARSRSPATARPIVYMGLAGPNDIVKLPMLASLAQDKTIRFSWLYPNQWPKTIRLLREGVVDTVEDHHPLDRARRINDGDRAGRPPRGRRHQDHRQALGEADGQAEVLRLRDHDVPPDVRRGSRELPRGGRRRASASGSSSCPRATTPRRASRSSKDSGLKATTMIPGTLSIYPVPFPGPTIPAERTEELCATIRRFAPFEPRGRARACRVHPPRAATRTRRGA